MANIVFEPQLHISLKISDMTIHTSRNGTRSYANACTNESPLNCTEQLSAWTVAERSFQGASHLFTACRCVERAVGLAWLGTVCNARWNTGVVSVSAIDPWLVFTHELGHNFGAHHSFEEGVGTTGGIMDYGNGMYRGHFQFNRQYRKSQMCSLMNRTVNRCQGKFAPKAAFYKWAGSPRLSL
mmetsp:Transcript_96291/g.206686  ORF Transcript_96291/g.206686 Transcript_96291/m.206686 type:complete len:183 (-) Transcript_96291:7-555(-)